MREFEDRVAVVTGGASGLGKAFAERFARAGMRVVLGDVEQSALDATVAELRQREYDVRGVLADVSDAASVERLAREAVDAYGGVHLLCNNAGVYGGLSGERLWEHTLKDWQWMFGVNVWGVVHGIRAFLPIMLEQDEEAHIVNTASLAGLFPGSGIYGASKHAVVAISESLHAQLTQLPSKIGVSVLCPGVVQTRIFVAERNRPDALRDDGAAASSEAEIAQREQQFGERIGERFEGVMQPDAVAEQVFEAVQEQRFWILPHGDRGDDVLKARFDSILERRNPEPREQFSLRQQQD